MDDDKEFVYIIPESSMEYLRKRLSRLIEKCEEHELHAVAEYLQDTLDLLNPMEIIE